MHWEQGGCGALGETTHNLSSGVCVCVCVSDKLAAEGRGEELLTPCPVQSLLQDSVLIPAEGLKLSVEGTSQADRLDVDRSRSQASLPSPTWIFSAPINLLLTLSQSLDLASI